MTNINAMLEKHKNNKNIASIINQKKIKRTTKRPWQEKVAAIKKDEDIEQSPTPEDFTNNTEGVLGPKSSEDNNDVEKLQKQLDKERRLFEKEKLKYQKNLKQTSRQMDFIQPSLANSKSSTIDGKEISYLNIYRITQFIKDLSLPEQLLYCVVLKETGYGKYKDVHIGYKEVEAIGLQSGQVKNARQGLQDKGLIETRIGRKSEKTKSVIFYSLKSFNSPAQ